MKGGIIMSVINKALTDCILKKYTVSDKVLRYSNESTEAKVERFTGLLNQLEHVLS